MIIIGSDHSGYELKDMIVRHLNSIGVGVLDVTQSDGYIPDDDYPDVARIICQNVLKDEKNFGIAICGTGIGISIASNKIKKIRAAVCTSVYMAEMARIDNDANVLCLGSRLDIASDKSQITSIVDKFINTSFGGGRHERRLNKIKEMENNN